MGYNYEYLVYIVFNNEVTDSFVNRLSTELNEILIEEYGCGVDLQQVEGLVRCTVKSERTVSESLMEDGYNKFMEIITAYPVQLVASIQSYDRTVDDINFFEDVNYQEFDESPVSAEMRDKLMALLSRDNAERLVFKYITSLQYGHLNSPEELDEEAVDWLDQFIELEDALYFEEDTEESEDKTAKYGEKYQELLNVFEKVIYESLDGNFESSLAFDSYTLEEYFIEIWENNGEILTELLDELLSYEVEEN